MPAEFNSGCPRKTRDCNRVLSAASAVPGERVYCGGNPLDERLTDYYILSILSFCLGAEPTRPFRSELC